MYTNIDILSEKELDKNNSIKDMQKSFLNSSLRQVIDNAVDIGLKSILPDLIEDEIINIKNTILENGFSSGVQEAIDRTIDFGKSAIGIVTGNFENTYQIELAVKKGGIIDTISNVLDSVIKKATENGVIDNYISSLLKNGKNTLLNTIEKNIETNLENQIKSVEKLQKFCEEWNKYYKEENYEKMNNTYKNIEKYLAKTLPLEKTFNEVKKIQNIHNLIKSKGGEFSLTENEKRLAEKLIT